MLKNERIWEKNMKSSRRWLVMSLTIACFLLAGTAANADTLVISLSAPYQSGSQGFFAFNATVVNTSASTVYLNGDDFSVDSPLIVDDSPFASYPFFLGAYDNQVDSTDSYTGVLFNVSVPPATPMGLYAGSFEILGSGDPNDDTTVAGSAVFNVNVTPEPSSLIPVLAGLAGLGGMLRRRRMAG